jgi:hypothetical protein
MAKVSIKNFQRVHSKYMSFCYWMSKKTYIEFIQDMQNKKKTKNYNNTYNTLCSITSDWFLVYLLILSQLYRLYYHQITWTEEHYF